MFGFSRRPRVDGPNRRASQVLEYLDPGRSATNPVIGRQGSLSSRELGTSVVEKRFHAFLVIFRIERDCLGGELRIGCVSK